MPCIRSLNAKSLAESPILRAVATSILPREISNTGRPSTSRLTRLLCFFSQRSDNTAANQIAKISMNTGTEISAL